MKTKTLQCVMKKLGQYLHECELYCCLMTRVMSGLCALRRMLALSTLLPIPALAASGLMCTSDITIRFMLIVVLVPIKYKILHGECRFTGDGHCRYHGNSTKSRIRNHNKLSLTAIGNQLWFTDKSRGPDFGNPDQSLPRQSLYDNDLIPWIYSKRYAASPQESDPIPRILQLQEMCASVRHHS